MRRTRHRRRFHTDRVVANRRAKFWRESHWWADRSEAWAERVLAYGRLKDRDPWDCGRPRCGICHSEKWPEHRHADRRRAERDWRRDWGV